MFKFDILVEKIIKESNDINLQDVERFSLRDLTNLNPNDTEKVKLVPYVLAKAYNKPGASAIINEILRRLTSIGINVDKNEIVEAAKKMNIPITDAYLRRINPDNSWINDMINKGELATTASSTTFNLQQQASNAVDTVKQKAQDLTQDAKDWYQTHGKSYLDKLTPKEREGILKHLYNLPRGRTKRATYGGPDLMGGRLGGTYTAPRQ